MLGCLCLVIAVCILGTRKRAIDGQNYGVKVSKDGMYFGTIFNITLYGNDEEKLKNTINDAYKECERLEKIFSAKLEDSELSNVNKNAYSSETVISGELYEVIEAAVLFGNMSDGSLNVTMGKVIDLWGIGTNNARIPSDDEISDYISCSVDDIVLNKEKCSIRFKSDNVKLDLGAIAKGYAANKIKNMITSENSSCVGMLNFGGNILQIGGKNGKDNWTVGITNPLDTNRVFATVSLKDMAIVTSGNYERYFEKDGKRYHHIIDPKSGYPSDNGVASATIIGPDSMKCDALSTIVFVCGKEKGLELIEAIDGYEAVIIDNNGKYYLSSCMSQFYFMPKI